MRNTRVLIASAAGVLVQELAEQMARAGIEAEIVEPSRQDELPEPLEMTRNERRLRKKAEAKRRRRRAISRR